MEISQNLAPRSATNLVFSVFAVALDNAYNLEDKTEFASSREPWVWLDANQSEIETFG